MTLFFALELILLFNSTDTCSPDALLKKLVYVCLPLFCRCYCHAGDIDRGLQTFENHINEGRPIAAELFVVSLVKVSRIFKYCISMFILV